MKNIVLGMIIAGHAKPFRWIKEIKDYEPMEDRKVYVTDTDNSGHIFGIDDIVWFDPENAIETLGGSAYYKIPNSCLTYAASFH